MSTTAEDRVISIGAAAREVGVTPHVLRKWQSRYDIVTPLRGRNGRRTYSRDQVSHLKQIKELLDAGIGMKELAKRSRAELSEMTTRLPNQQSFLLSIYGSPFIEVVEQAEKASSRLILQFNDQPWQSLMGASPDPADLFVVDVQNLDADTCRDLLVLHESVVSPIFVVYRYGQPASLELLHAANIKAYRGPVSLQLLEDLVISQYPRPHQEAHILAPVEPRRYTDAAVRKAANAASEIECECPGNIANILNDLYAFERYSLDCIASQPQDKAMHLYLHQTTANARVLFEEALGRLARYENIDLDIV